MKQASGVFFFFMVRWDGSVFCVWVRHDFCIKATRVQRLFFIVFVNLCMDIIHQSQGNEDISVGPVYMYIHKQAVYSSVDLSPQERLHLFAPNDLSLVHCDFGYSAAT